MSYRIVVADKDPKSQEAVKRSLVQEDNEFINVSSSGELKEAIKNHRPDLIILNSLLTDVPGWRLIQRIKGSRDFSHIPILLMTGDPGGPPPAEARTSGADGYLSKPIDGVTLKDTVESLLGLRNGIAGESADEEIMIDFTDEDSGEMTEELLAMSNAALDSEDLSTEVGDTVEIDTGTLIAELDHTKEMAKDETYEDTVRLNLEDMGLDDDEAFEPTIELVSDVPTDLGSTGTSEVLEIDLDSHVTLPDFETVTQDVPEAGSGEKHSVTVDMDVDDLGLELESEEPIEEFASKEMSDIDADDTEIGKILDVQEPSKVLTSEDLMLDDDSLIEDPSSSAEFDVIDLEQDSEIREIDMEELEAIHTPEESLATDLDDTVPVENQEMEQLANEDLDEIQIDDSGDITLGLETPQVASSSYESTEELTLDEIGEEEITTQEFFGEELPTEEFPTERFPEEKTGDLNLEEVSLDLSETPGEISLDETPAFGEIPIEEITLDAASAEDILFADSREEEPMLEVTEDISFDEISLEDEIEEVPEAQPTVAPGPTTAERIAEIAGGTLAAGAVAAAASKIAGLASESKEAAQAKPSPPPAHELLRAASASPEEMAPSLEISPQPEKAEQVSAAAAERAPFSEPITRAREAFVPDKDEFSETLRQAMQSSIPSKQEVLDSIVRDLARSLPTREDIFSRVDEIVGGSLPSEDEIAERVERSIQAVLPLAEMVAERVDRAVRAVLPSSEIVAQRLDSAVQAMLPSSEMIVERVDGVMQTALPSAEMVAEQVDRAVQAMLPSSEMVVERVDRVMQIALPSAEVVTQRMDSAMQATLPSPEMVGERLEKGLLSLLPRDEVSRRFEETVEKLLSSDDLKRTVQEAFQDIPSREFIKEALDTALATAISPELVAERVDSALRGMPSQEYIRIRLDNAFAALPSADIVNERLNSALQAIPTADHIMSRIDQSLEFLTSPEGAAAQIDDRLSSLLPEKEEIRAAFQAMLEQRVERIMAGVDARALADKLFPGTDRILETIKSALPEKEHIQETLGLGIAEAIQNSLPERVWLESVSRGLFDERTRGLLPKREEIVNMLREEINLKLLGTVEKIVREQIETITSDLS